MDFESFLEMLATLLECKTEDLSLDTSLSDIENWDSVAVLGVITMASESFNKDLSLEDVSKVNTIGELYSLLSSK